MTRFSLLIIVIACVSILINAVQCQRGYTMRSDIESYEALAKLERDSAKLWRDDAGRSRATAEVAVANLDAVKHVYGKDITALADDIKGLKKNLRNLESYTVTNLVTRGEISTGLRDTTIINNVPSKTFGYHDEWINMSAVITDSVKLKYQVRDSLQFVYYYENRGLFKKPALVIDAISHNPNATITGIKSIRIKPPEKMRIGIGVYGGYGVSQHGLSPQIGVGVYYKLLEL